MAFDYTALVRAMGPQRDPYSWAEGYSMDAAKEQALMKQLAMQEQQKLEEREFRAGEGEKDRGSRRDLAFELEKLRGDNAAERVRMRGEYNTRAQESEREQAAIAHAQQFGEVISGPKAQAILTDPRTAKDPLLKQITFGRNPVYVKLDPKKAAGFQPNAPQTKPQQRKVVDDYDDTEE